MKQSTALIEQTTVETMDSDAIMIGNKMLMEFDCKCKSTCDQRDYKLVTKKPKESYTKLTQNVFGDIHLKEVVISEGTPVTQVSDYIFSQFLHGIVQYHVLEEIGSIKVKEGYVLKVEYNMIGDEEVTYSYEGDVGIEQIHGDSKDVIICVWLEKK